MTSLQPQVTALPSLGQPAVPPNSQVQYFLCRLKTGDVLLLHEAQHNALYPDTGFWHDRGPTSRPSK